MTHSLNKITLKGFKSIRSLVDFELTNLNVLIGGNGAGKSNFIDFFRLLRAMMELSLPDLSSSSLKTYIANGGGSDDFLFNGPKVTAHIEAEMHFGDNGYRFIWFLLQKKRFSSMTNQDTMLKGLPDGGIWELGTKLQNYWLKKI